MALLSATGTQTGGSYLEVSINGSYEVIAGITSFSAFGAGAATKINTTDLRSDVMETVKGLPTEGTVSCAGIFVASDDVHNDLFNERKAPGVRSFRFHYGGTRSNATKLTDGTALPLSDEVSNYTSIVAGSGDEYTFNFGLQSGLPGVRRGDYVVEGSNSYLVKSVSVDPTTRNGRVVVESSTDISDVSSGTCSFVRPGARFTFSGSVDEFVPDFNTDDVARFTLSIGSITDAVLEIGTPDLS